MQHSYVSKNRVKVLPSLDGKTCRNQQQQKQHFHYLFMTLCELYQAFIIKFPYNARSDWLKQRALSENRARVDEGKLASSNFCFGILANLAQIKHPLWLRQMQWKRAICLQ